VPYVNAVVKKGNAETYADCNGGSTYYDYTVRLLNRAGNVLTQTSSAYFGNHWITSLYVSCAGAYVRSYLYINAYGTGRSDTSAENPDCAY
jgi:hypothetical protein